MYTFVLLDYLAVLEVLSGDIAIEALVKTLLLYEVVVLPAFLGLLEYRLDLVYLLTAIEQLG